MKTRSVVTKAAKIQFVKKHKVLADVAFHMPFCNDDRQNKIVEIARQELKYSNRTYGLDIFYSLDNIWCELKGRRR